MTETVFRCKDCEFCPKGETFDFYCLEAKTSRLIFDPPCGEFELGKEGED